MLLFTDAVALLSALLLAVLLDMLVGEPRRAHPLVSFGYFASWLERHLFRDSRLMGALAWSLAVLPLVGVCIALSAWAPVIAQALILYFCIAYRSLHDHSLAVQQALTANDIGLARQRLSLIVSRDTEALDTQGIAVATVESTLENSSDAIFASLFCFLLLGAPGAIMHRLSNTLDAMWGYKTPRYWYFGRAAARCDDVLNYLPARLTALGFCLLGPCRGKALQAWFTQSANLASPNAGVVMASGGGALDISLGGRSCYYGQWMNKVRFGGGETAQAESIGKALALCQKSLLLWVLGIALALLLITY